MNTSETHKGGHSEKSVEKNIVENTCTGKCANMCMGNCFWFWAAIRIIIVVMIILGAFCTGIKVGEHHGRNGYQMNDGRYNEDNRIHKNFRRDGGNNIPMNPVVKPPITSTGSNTPSLSSGSTSTGTRIR